MDQVMRELLRQAMESGDLIALQRLVNELMRAGRSGEIIKVIRDFLKAHPGQAEGVRELAKSLPPKIARKADALAKVVQKWGKLPKVMRWPRLGGPSGGWLLHFKRGVGSVARAVAKTGYRLLAGVGRLMAGAGQGLRVLAGFALRALGPIGLGLTLLAILVLIGIGLYLYLYKSGSTGAPNCDCMGVDAGLLTGPYREQCNGREQRLLSLAADGKLNLQIGDDGKIVSGEFCDPVASGPRAWPVQGAPSKAPEGVPRYQPCTPRGLVQKCD